MYILTHICVNSKSDTRAKQKRKPVVCLASGLHEAGLVCLSQQLLCESHEPRMFHQAASLRHLSRQRLAAFLPRRLQGLGERGVTLGESGRQVPDALGQLLSGRHAVHLVAQTREEFTELKWLHKFKYNQVQILKDWMQCKKCNTPARKYKHVIIGV